jgi:hypothetical protein
VTYCDWADWRHCHSAKSTCFWIDESLVHVIHLWVLIGHRSLEGSHTIWQLVDIPFLHCVSQPSSVHLMVKKHCPDKCCTSVNKNIFSLHNDMVHTWVGHKVPTLGLSFGTCLHTTSDDNDNQMRPQHTTRTHNKHHHHGGQATSPSGSVDLMNPHHPRDWRPCGIFSEAVAMGFQ